MGERRRGRVKRNLRTVTINKIEMRMIQQPVGKKRGPATQ